MIELFHSSDTRPVIGSHRMFDGFLFFSEYAQRARGTKIFTAVVDAGDIIDVETVLQHEIDGKMRGLVAEAQAIVSAQHCIEIDADTAEDLLTQRVVYGERLVDAGIDRDDFDSYAEFDEMLQHERSMFEHDADTAWKLQMLGALAARIAGFRGVRLSDEMGRSVAVWLEGRDEDLVEHTEE